jgi:predicted RNase H-like HicB family nuclease
MRYAVIFEKSETSFGAYVPDLPGCVAAGDSLAEAKTLIAEAMKLHLAALKAQGLGMPEPASVVAYIEA